MSLSEAVSGSELWADNGGVPPQLWNFRSPFRPNERMNPQREQPSVNALRASHSHYHLARQVLVSGHQHALFVAGADVPVPVFQPFLIFA